MAVLAVSVEEIAAMRDPVVRNLCITQRYHELALQLRGEGLREDATWCAFAVWASKTAGQTIRGEELPARVHALLEQGDPSHTASQRSQQGAERWLLERVDRTLPARVIKEVADLVAQAIAEGNLIVFRELAPLFTALLADGGSGPNFDRALDALMASGQETAVVTAAFESYQKALAEEEGRSARVLAANILAVSHEQERLQRAICTALDVGITDTMVKHGHHAAQRLWPWTPVRRVFGRVLDDVGKVLEHAWQTALTEAMLRLETPDETFVLHHSVPPVNGVLFPPPLHDLDGTEAAEPYARWDKTAGTGTPSGAHDWGVMEERMNFIVTLFRSRQRHPGLFAPPFTDAQLAALNDGRLPAGPL